MFHADRREDMKRGLDCGDSARLATRADYYHPWLRRERNCLARTAEFPIPYFAVGFDRPLDNGERFYVEYAR